MNLIHQGNVHGKTSTAEKNPDPSSRSLILMIQFAEPRQTEKRLFKNTVLKEGYTHSALFYCPFLLFPLSLVSCAHQVFELKRP